MEGAELIQAPLTTPWRLVALGSPPSAPTGKAPEPRTTEKAAKDFEAVLLHKLLEEMRRTIPESGLLDNGISQQVQDMFWLYLSQDVGAKGALGLWKQLAREMDCLSASAEARPSMEHVR